MNNNSEPWGFYPTKSGKILAEYPCKQFQHEKIAKAAENVLIVNRFCYGFEYTGTLYL